MASSCLSSITQLLCTESLPVTFAHLIREVDRLLEPCSSAEFKISWDSDQVATFDQPGTRVLLGWTEHPGHGLSGVLTLSVGPSPFLGKPVMRPDHQALSAHLVQQMQVRLSAANILHDQMACVMTSDWVDLLIDALPDMNDLLDEGSPDRAAYFRASPTRAKRAPLRPQTTHKPEDRNTRDDPRLSDLRQALQDTSTRPHNGNQPLTIHALQAGVHLILLPWGIVTLAQAAMERF